MNFGQLFLLYLLDKAVALMATVCETASHETRTSWSKRPNYPGDRRPIVSTTHNNYKADNESEIIQPICSRWNAEYLSYWNCPTAGFFIYFAASKFVMLLMPRCLSRLFYRYSIHSQTDRRASRTARFNPRCQGGCGRLQLVVVISLLFYSHARQW